MNKFNLTFTEALEVLANNSAWVQGENFLPSIVLTNVSGTIKLKDLKGNSLGNTPLTVGVMKQKYRELHFETELDY